MKEIFKALDQVSGSLGEKIEEQTPLYHFADRLFSSLDPKILDRLATETWFFSNQFGFENRLKTPTAKRSVRGWLGKIREGEIAPFAEYARGNCDGYNFLFEGQENLSDQAGIYVSNHPCGPMLGTWYPYVIDWAISEKLGGLEKVPRWFLKEYSEGYISGGTPLRIFKERATQMMAKSNRMILIKRDRSTFPPMLKEAKSHLESGGSLAISFEEHNNHQLERARPGVGLFLRILSENGRFPIRPVGCWKEGDDLQVNFGEPINLGEFLGQLPVDIQDKARSQRTIDYIAAHVALLLPEKHRGVYGKFVK